jgi:hypothetical protein
MLSGSLLHALLRTSAQERSAFHGRRRRQSQGFDRRSMFREIGAQTRDVIAEHLSRVSRAGHQGGVNAVSSEVRTHADPAKGRVLKSRLGMVSPGLNPGRSSFAWFGIEGREGLLRARPR